MASRVAPRGAAPRFVYKPRAADAAINRMQQYNSGNRDGYLEGNVETFQAAEGDNWIRLLPPTWTNAEHYAFDLFVHYEVGPDKATYLCIEKMFDKMEAAGFPIGDEFLTDGAPICAMCEELRRAQRAGEEKYARALDSSLRLAAWVLNRNEEGKGPKMWLYPITNDREILAQATDKRTGEVMAVDHPEEGYDLDFHRKGKGMQTKYSGFKLQHRSSPVDDKHIAFVVENPIPKLLKFYTFDHIMEVFAGPAAVPEKTNARPKDDIDDEKDSADIPHDPPPEKPAAPSRRSPLVTPKEEPKAADTPAAAATPTNNRRRAAKPAGPVMPDFAAMDINAQCDWADGNNVAIPDTLGDDEVPAFLAEEWKKLNP